MIWLFDGELTLVDVGKAELDLRVTGEDAFVLMGQSPIKEISRDREDLAAQTLDRHHQFPDGFMLFLGTLFAPT